jgi:hypothetical protein
MNEEVHRIDAAASRAARDPVVEVTVSPGSAVQVPVVTTAVGIPVVPPVREFASVDEYRDHFVRQLCGGPVITHDGISVRFRRRDFNHCCFKSTKRDDEKDCFCEQRAKRIDWIRYALQLPGAELYVGWNKRVRGYDPDRRVVIVQNSFVAVITMLEDKKADFVTAYFCADRETIQKIRRGPEWPSDGERKKNAAIRQAGSRRP